MSGNDAEEPRGATPDGQDSGAARPPARRTRRRAPEPPVASATSSAPPPPPPPPPPGGAGRPSEDFDVDREIDQAFDLDAKTYSRFTLSRLAATATALPRLAPRMAVCAGVGIAFGWIANVIVMAGKYDGFVVPRGTTASGQGNVVRGASFWFVAAMVVSAVVNHRINAGPDRFWNDVRGFPDTLRGLARNDDASTVHALWGFAGATIITYTLGPSLSGAVAVGVVVAVGTLFRPVLVGGLLLAWRWIVKKVAPQSPNRAGMQAVTITTLGGAAAMGLTVVVTGAGTRLILGVGAAIAAVVLSQRRVPGVGTAVVLFGAVGATAFVVLGADAAFADDGGWRECGSSFTNWWNCSGSDRARWLAIYGAGGSGLGAALGAALPGYQGPPKPWSDMTDEERAAFKDDYIRRFIETHPNATPEQIQRFREGLDAREPGFWENAWEAVKDFGDAYWEDLASGKQAEGMAGFFVEGWEGFSGAAGATWDEVMMLDETLVELPGVWDWEWDEKKKAIGGLVESVKYAGEFYSDPGHRQALVDEYGPEAVDAVFAKLHELDQAMQHADPTVIREKLGEITGMVEFGVLLGGIGDKGTKETLAFLQEVRASGAIDDVIATLRGSATEWVATRAEAKAASEIAARLERLGEIVPDPSLTQQANFLLGESPEMMQTWLQTLDEASLKQLYGNARIGALEALEYGDDFSSHAGEITKAIGEMGLPDKWAVDQVNRLASGAEVPWFARGDSIEDSRDLAERWLESNKMLIEGDVPTVDELLARWSEAP